MRYLLVSGCCRSFSAVTEYFLYFHLSSLSTSTPNNNLHLVIKTCLASIKDSNLLHSCGTCITPPLLGAGLNQARWVTVPANRAGTGERNSSANLYPCTHLKTGGLEHRSFVLMHIELRKKEGRLSGRNVFRGHRSSVGNSGGAQSKHRAESMQPFSRGN